MSLPLCFLILNLTNDAVLHEENWDKLPPATITNAHKDPLRDHGAMIAELLRGNNVDGQELLLLYVRQKDANVRGPFTSCPHSVHDGNPRIFRDTSANYTLFYFDTLTSHFAGRGKQRSRGGGDLRTTESIRNRQTLKDCWQLHFF